MGSKANGSKHNAIKHGIFAGTLLSGPGSAEVEEFEQLLSGASQAIRPTNAVEEALTEMFAFKILTLKRAHKADSEIAPQLFALIKDYLTQKIESPFPGFNESIVRNEKTPTIDSLIRYQTSIVRQMGRILSLIQQLRQMRVIEAVPISLAPDASERPSSIPSQDPELH